MDHNFDKRVEQRNMQARAKVLSRDKALMKALGVKNLHVWPVLRVERWR